MSAWCCVGAMGTALSQQEECSADPAEPQPPTMADFMRMRRRKGGALWTLRRRLRRAAPPPEREAGLARTLRSVVAGWSRAELCAALHVARRELARAHAHTRAQAARPRAAPPALTSWRDVTLACSDGVLTAHAFVLAARTRHWRALAEQLQPHRTLSLPASCGAVTRGELLAVLRVIYDGNYVAAEEVDGCPGLDIVDNNAERADGPGEARAPARLLAALGVSSGEFGADMLRAWGDGLLADCTLCVSSRRFPCHRAVLAAASRYFRCVVGMCAAEAGGHSSLVVDPLVLPPRFMRALLHCAYTSQVDISLIEPETPPSAAAPTVDDYSQLGTIKPTDGGWGSAKGSKVAAADKLDDIFQLYEIAKFCEMEHCAYVCSALAVSCLSPHNVARAVTWGRQAHASPHVLRGALAFVSANFPACVSRCAPCPCPSPCAGPSPCPAPCSGTVWAARAALAGPSLSCSDDAAARALIHHARQHHSESVWGRGGGGGGGGGGAGGSCAGLRQFLAPLLPHIRTEHLPDNHPLFTLGVCGRVSADPKDAWLGRGVWRPPRPLPAYIHALESLVGDNPVSASEVQAVLRANTMPDTLYMVGECARAPAVCGGGSSRSSALVSRVTRLVREEPAWLQTDTVLLKHICLQAVREFGLPASCVDDTLAEYLRAAGSEESNDGEGNSTPRHVHKDWADDGLESVGAEGGALSSERTSLRIQSQRDSRRRELPAVVAEGQPLSACRAVPDVAAPDGNTHLLYPATGPVGRVLTLDLGDGALHAPARGSRARRATRAREGQAPPGGRARTSTEGSGSELDLPDAAACALYPPRRLTPSPTYKPQPRSQHLSLTHTAFNSQYNKRNSQMYGESSQHCDMGTDSFGHGHYLHSGKDEDFGHETYKSENFGHETYKTENFGHETYKTENFGHEPYKTENFGHETYKAENFGHETYKNENFDHDKYLNSGINENSRQQNYSNSEENKHLSHENHSKRDKTQNYNIPCPTEFENCQNRARISVNDSDRDDFLQDLDDSEFYTSGMTDLKGTYRDLRTQSELYNTKNIEPKCHLDYLQTKFPRHLETKRSQTNSLQRNFKHKSNNLELYSRQNNQSTSNDDRIVQNRDYINCTLPKNSSNFNRIQDNFPSGTSLPTECFAEKEFYNKNCTKADFLNKHQKTKDSYKERYQKARDQQKLGEREKTQTNQNYVLDNIELKSLKIHCDSYSSGKDYHTGSLKIHKGKNTHNLGIKNVSKDFGTLNTRNDSCGSISSHGTLMPRSNSSLSGRNSAQSSQSSHISAQSPHLGVHSGHLSAQSGHLSAQSGHLSAQSGHLSAQSGHLSAQSGHLSAQSGHTSVTGRSSPRSGLLNSSPYSSMGHATPTHIVGTYSSQTAQVLGVSTQKSPGTLFNLSQKKQNCEVPHSASLDYVVRDSMSPRHNVSPRDSVSSRDGLCERDRLSPRNVMSTRDLSSRDTISTRDMSPRDRRSPRDAVSSQNLSSLVVSARDTMSARDVERVRQALPGHVRPRSKEREQVFSLHTAHSSHPSDVRSPNHYRVETDIGRPHTPPRHQ